MDWHKFNYTLCFNILIFACIKEKEEQKELAKKNSKENEQRLSDFRKRQSEIDYEIEDNKMRLLKYEAAKKQVIDKFVSSPEFLNMWRTEVYNSSKEEEGKERQKSKSMNENSAK